MADRADLVIVDDGLVHGGGQIGLARYLRVGSALAREVVLLAPSRVADDASAGGVPAVVLQRTRNRRGLPLAWLRLVVRNLAAAPAQTVVANSLMAAIVLAATPKRGRRFVYYLREDFSPEWISGVKRWIVQHLVFPRYDGFLANSAWTASTLPAGRAGPRRAHVAYPLSGITADAPLPTPSGSTTLRVLSLSRITPWKGIDVVMDAAVELGGRVPIQLTVAGAVAAGDEQWADDLRARPAPAGVGIEFTGHVDDVEALLATHDVLVVASRHPEPFGQVVIQALAWGLGVIASDQGGPADVLADEPLGRLVPPGDPVALADELAAFAAHPPTLAERESSARSARARYADSALATAFEHAVRSAVAD